MKYIAQDLPKQNSFTFMCFSGCFMFRLSALQEIEQNGEFFDDQFFMYFEDFDLIRCLHKVGKTLFYPAVKIIHDHATESYKSRKMLRAHIKSAFRYFNKWGWIFDRERKAWNGEILEKVNETDMSLKMKTNIKKIYESCADYWGRVTLFNVVIYVATSFYRRVA